MVPPVRRALVFGGFLALSIGACAAEDDSQAGPAPTPDGSGVEDAGWPLSDAAPDAPADVEPEPLPASRVPCATDQCWKAPALGGLCGSSTLSEDFSSGKYNVHEYALSLPAGEMVDLTATVTGGSWNPALIVNATDGTTLFDGEVGASGAINVAAVNSGRAGDTARVGLVATADTSVSVFVTGWTVVDGAFAPPMPSDASYDLVTDVDCVPPSPGTLLSPPNFDPLDVVNGYYLLPDSQPPGLYTRKGVGCSRGNKLLIDVVYTVATHWKPLYPSLSPLAVKDLNENVALCKTNHDTHADGTHVDITAGCATDIGCADKAPKIALAKLFVDTGVACGILNNDTAVQQTVNDYFAQKTNYAPWNGKFMRSVTGHTQHFHVRVKKPDGTCN